MLLTNEQREKLEKKYAMEMAKLCGEKVTAILHNGNLIIEASEIACLRIAYVYCKDAILVNYDQEIKQWFIVIYFWTDRCLRRKK